MTAAFAILILAIVTSQYTVYWSGAFLLKVDLQLAPEIDRDSLRYYQCWHKSSAEILCRDLEAPILGATSPYQSKERTDILNVSAGGKKYALKYFDTFHHPAALIVVYRRKGMAIDAPALKTYIDLPNGRGDRSIILKLPNTRSSMQNEASRTRCNQIGDRQSS